MTFISELVFRFSLCLLKLFTSNCILISIILLMLKIISSISDLHTLADILHNDFTIPLISILRYIFCLVLFPFTEHYILVAIIYLLFSYMCMCQLYNYLFISGANSSTGCNFDLISLVSNFTNNYSENILLKNTFKCNVYDSSNFNLCCYWKLPQRNIINGSASDKSFT